MEAVSYESNFDDLKLLIYRGLLVLPATSILILLFKYFYKYLTNKKSMEVEDEDRSSIERKYSIKGISDTAETYRLARSLDVTKRSSILELFRSMPEEYCLVNFLSEPHSFFLINDIDLIKSIRSDESAEGLFEPQLYQPYLVLDSNCDLKLKKLEYEKLIRPILKKHFNKNENHFTKHLIPKEFKEFTAKNKEANQKDIFELIFRLSTAYIKSLFSITTTSNTLSSEEKLILFHLFEIHQTFTLGLFTNSSPDLVSDYSTSYKEFMRLIEQTFHIQTDLANDTDQIKFLIIKNVYLDSLKIYSVLTWFLRDISLDESTEAESLRQEMKLECHFESMSSASSNYFKEKLLKNYLKTLSVDLYYMSSKCKIPSKFSFLPIEKLIVLNLFNLVRETEMDENCSGNFNLLDDFIKTMSMYLVGFFIKNFDVEQSELLESSRTNRELCYDLPLIRYYDSC